MEDNYLGEAIVRHIRILLLFKDMLHIQTFLSHTYMYNVHVHVLLSLKLNEGITTTQISMYVHVLYVTVDEKMGLNIYNISSLENTWY